MGRAFLKKHLDASFEFSAFSLPGKDFKSEMIPFYPINAF